MQHILWLGRIGLDRKAGCFYYSTRPIMADRWRDPMLLGLIYLLSYARVHDAFQCPAFRRSRQS